jgi:putative transposase
VSCDTYRHRRRSIRLKGYDYAQACAYFVTICTQDSECFFGDVVGGMQMNDAGQMVCRIWNDLPVKYPGIEIDEFILMPNHFHGIVVIVGAPLVGALPSGTVIGNNETRAGTRPAPTLGDVVGAFKSITTQQYAYGVRQNNWPPFRGKLWQRNYYEHVIRNEEEMERIRQYIVGNPAKWDEDEDNPANIIHGKHDVGAPLVGALPPTTNIPCPSNP